jgi:hypothetical protein
MRTLSSTIEELVGQGYTANFGVVGDRLRAFDSGKTFAAHEVMNPRLPAVRRRLRPRRHGGRLCDREPGPDPRVLGGRLRRLLERHSGGVPPGRADSNGCPTRGWSARVKWLR